MTYLGVYSNTVATTNVGTELELKKNPKTKKNELSVKSTAVQDRHSFSTGSLEGANLNVAKIRVVSTLPDKEVDAKIRGKAYVGFILTEVQETHNEKVELVPLPGDTYASYFYGASPRQFNFNGVLLNTEQDKWRDSFEQLYEKYLRGSASSRNFNIVQIRYGGRIVSGWLLNMSQQQSSQSDLYAQFSFSVLVSRIDMLNKSKDNYVDYLVDQADAFKASDLSKDYAILDNSNYNSMVNPIRTGTIVPPKRPRRSGGRRRGNNGCYFTNMEGDAGNDNLNGSATISDHINDSSTCTVFDAIQNQRDKIANIAKELNDKIAKGNISEAEVDRLAKAKEDMIKNLNKKLKDPVVIRSAQRDSDAAELYKYNQSVDESKRVDSVHKIPYRKEQTDSLKGGHGFSNSRTEVLGKDGNVVGYTERELAKSNKGDIVIRTTARSTFKDVSNERMSEIESGKGEPPTTEEEKNEGVQAAMAVNAAREQVKKNKAKAAADREKKDQSDANAKAKKTRTRTKQ